MVEEEKLSADTEKTLEKEEQKKKDKSLKYSLLDSGFGSVTASMSDNFINPFALALGATTSQIGFLKSIPQIASSFFQLASTELSDRFMNRKKFVLISILLQALVFIPFIAVALFFRNAWVVIVCASLYSMLGSFANPPWSSWMGDLVDPKTRGQYFGRRNAIAGAVALATTLVSGLILNYFKMLDNSVVGFVFLFAIALFAKLVSFFFLTLMYEPEYSVKKESYFSLWSFLQKAPSNNFGRFVIFASAMNLAMNLGGPFFTVYLLRDLQFSYFQYTMLVMVAAIAQFLDIGYWGKIGDRFGNRTVLLITGMLAVFRPVLWMISPNFYVLLVVQTINGFGAGGFDLATSNYILDAVTRERRARCVSYFNFLKGIGIFIGASVAGLIAFSLPHLDFLRYDIYLLFILSAAARLFVVVALLPMLKEVKEGVEPTPTYLYLRLGSVEPMRELFSGAYNSFNLGIKNAGHVREGLAHLGDRFKKK